MGEAAAKASAKHAKMAKKKKKAGNKKSSFRYLPGHDDLADICDGAAKHMAQQSDKVEKLIEKVLADSTRHNFPTASPKTRVQMLEEASACDDRIRNLKRDLKQAQDDEDQVEVGDCHQRLSYYNQ